MTLDYGISPPSYRLPAATRLGAVRLQVSDLERSLAYYTRVLGFRVLRQDVRSADLGAVGGSTVLVQLHQRPGVRRAGRGPLGLYHFAVLLPGRDALGSFVAHLADVRAHIGSADHLVSEALYLTDPDGLGIEVYADRPRSDWRTEGRELAMTTRPLDLGALVRASGGRPWLGPPAGTTIGHIHLYVGSLGTAEAFYHSALGFDKVVWSYPGALFLSAGGYHHHLGTNTWAAGASPATDDDARLLEWELVLPDAADVHTAAQHVSAAGYPVTQAGEDRLLTDPWGTSLRLTHKE